MIEFTPFSPVFLKIFWLSFYYYGLFYAISFSFGYIFLRKNLKSVSESEFDKMYFGMAILWLLFWRLFHIFIYDFYYFSSHFLEIFKVWKWWMASHWGFFWGFLWLILFKPKNFKFIKFLDLVVIPLSFGFWIWRIWNFINWEILWTSTNLIWAYDFWDWILRHPVQLYSSLFNFLLFGILLFIFYKKIFKEWFLLYFFLIFYWIWRIYLEFFKDNFSWNNYFEVLTTGQFLSFFMIFIGIFWFFRKKYFF
jgi:phosphatidylglycerol:prolipoprotein diacylglycerol transferase